MEPIESELMMPGQAAKMLGVSLQTVRKLLRNGKLTGIYLNTHRRIYRSSVLAILRSGGTLDPKSKIPDGIKPTV